MLEPYNSDSIYIVVIGFIVSFVLAFAVGANDVANSFGTSVGSKVLTLRQACILASIFEVLGAVLVGYKVSDTMRKGIIDVAMFNNTEKELMFGSLAALGGSGIWQIIATYMKLPVSGTHSIVGATVGFSLIARGTAGVQWLALAKIAVSWILSPLLSGAVSSAVYGLIYFSILRKKHSLESGLRYLPLIYASAVSINMFSILHDGPSLLMLDRVPWWGSLISAVILGLIVAIFVRIFTVPQLRRKTDHEIRETSVARSVPGSAAGEEAVTMSDRGLEPTVRFSSGDRDSAAKVPLMVNGDTAHHKLGNGHTTDLADVYVISPETEDLSTVNMDLGNGNHCDHPGDHGSESPVGASTLELTPSRQPRPSLGIEISEHDASPADPIFSFLQILTACFGAFAHGGNDVSNTIGPLVALWLIFAEGNVAQKAETPIYILLYGGVGMVIGLWVWGRRVIETIGTDLTHITPHSGFTIEIGSALTVLLASKIGLPVSTTHCKVGSVVIIGSIIHKFRQGVKWSIFRNILLAWIVTVPVAGGISALLMWIFLSSGMA